MAEHHGYLLEIEALMFKADNHYAARPADWENPEQALNTHQFSLLEACAEKLPAAMGRVFLMREWLELPSDESARN